MIKEFVEEMRKELENPLPGMEAHWKAVPRVRRDVKDFLTPGKDAKRGGVLVLFYQDGQGNICFPLIERSIYNGAHSGQISLPGGKVEDQETFIETALRETEEEIGYPISKIRVLGMLSKIFVSVSNFSVQPVIGYTDGYPEFTPEPIEVRRVLEARLSDLTREGNIREKKIQISSGLSIDAPYYDLAGEVVWGATAMILSELSELVRRSGRLKNLI